MWNSKITFVALSLSMIAGCTQGTSSFNVLDQNAIPRPLFGGQSLLNIIDLVTTDEHAINGQCDPKIKGIIFSATGTSVDFSQTTNVVDGALSLNCATTGTFSFTLKSLTDLGFTPAMNTSYVVQLRALTDGGTSNPSTINILYSTATLGPKRVQISSGANLSSTTAGAPRLATSTNFKAEVRVGHMVNSYASPATSADAMSLKTSAHFRMKAGIAADHD